MKWWGWGEESVSFTHEGKPELAPFIERHLQLDVTRPGSPPVGFEDLRIPDSRLPAPLRARLEEVVGAGHVSSDDHDRVVHGRGKSLTDLVRQRRGDLGRLPDVVVRPGAEDEVVAVMEAALAADVVVIPFGGGSSISGSLEPEAGESRPVISVDMVRMSRVLAIDATSQLARVQTGVFGPDLERQLNAQGWTCGHFPDSFTHSTLGGWIATRSSGMQSDRYGDVAELTRGLRVVTPSGMLVVRPVPSTSTGPSVREMVLGSEGRLGIITEATIHVRRVPAERKILGYLFPTWAAGLAAMRDIAAGEASPSVTRVSDAHETAFSFATRTDPTPLDRVKSKALRAFLKRKGWDPAAMCLSFIGYEGSEGEVAAQRKQTERITKRHGGLCIGSSPGAPTCRRRRRPGASYRPSTTT
jgi:alkyldihydroxyacetonephosphate synthase